MRSLLSNIMIHRRAVKSLLTPALAQALLFQPPHLPARRHASLRSRQAIARVALRRKSANNRRRNRPPPKGTRELRRHFALRNASSLTFAMRARKRASDARRRVRNANAATRWSTKRVTKTYAVRAWQARRRRALEMVLRKFRERVRP